ncbi:hypothetical protein OZN62_09920 [Aurantiacibacter sp. MUD11]|uniref:hypothetical protein n=1 Tax=Aurantiacibacter sp. MUD11 TaxID=3003265 RepID=UPI0022AA0627|nr:hypothetical protein [Aurantiacibacter sp. MUD11]WAT17245.1 hypothetical protein OZN62_09920 [Aurantiacibacter sp. MUD11]
MATAKPAAKRRGALLFKLLVALAVIGGAVAWFFGDAITGYAQAGTGYAAKNACSCRHLGGRELNQCEDDLLPGMAAIWLSEDEAEHSVTASIPLLHSETASFEEGFGCVLEPYEG